MRKRPNYYPNDGYTIPGYIEGVEGLYEPLRFTYRPVGLELQAEWDRKLETLKGQADVRKRAELLAERVKTWNLSPAGGEDVLPVNAASLRGMQPSLFWKLAGIVCGRIPTDIDPTWPEEIQEEEADIRGDAGGGTPGEVREARDAKN